MRRSSARWEVWEVEGAGVSSLHLVIIGKTCNERHSGWDDVGGGCICGQEVTGGSGVEDGPISDGSGIC